MPLINFPLLGEEGKVSLFHHLGTALSAAARLSRRLCGGTQDAHIFDLCDVHRILKFNSSAQLKESTYV
jgi:hypothetical protein